MGKMVKCIYATTYSKRYMNVGSVYEVEQEFDNLYRLKGVEQEWWKDFFEDVTRENATEASPEYTGASVNYYTVRVEHPTNSGASPYTAECNDIIEALGMNFAEGNAFKALWRSCAARNLGKNKKGYDEGLYDAEKVVFFGTRMIQMANRKVRAK